MSVISPSTPMRRSRGFYGMLLGQVIVVVAFGSAWGTMPESQRIQLEQQFETQAVASEVTVARDMPVRIAPLYDDPRVVSDSQLLAVLRRIVPRFEYTRLKPNFAEHALRAWSAEAHFSEPGILSGTDLRDFLINHARFVASWGEQIDGLLVDTPTGIAVRYGFDQCGSVHHDHALACLAEAGVPLSQPIFSPGRTGATLNTAFQEALRDFRLDEQEAEWSALLFALYLPSEARWRNSAGREISFDLLVKRLIRGDKRLGVCSGTHRVYTLAVLLRLDDEHQLLSSSARGDALRFLHDVRELLLVSQFEDGSWPPDWSRGADAVHKPQDAEPHRTVISTGHHLEWLAIAPEELQPPRERVIRAAAWVIENTLSQTDETIGRNYTFYSHVGAALAAWRRTTAWRFWEAHAPSAADIQNTPQSL